MPAPDSIRPAPSRQIWPSTRWNGSLGPAAIAYGCAASAMAPPSSGDSTHASIVAPAPERVNSAMPAGAPTASAAKMAIPVHDIDMPARCGPTDAIDHATHPVTNWLSPNPAARRPRIRMARLAPAERPGKVATRYSSPPSAHHSAPCSAARRPPCTSATRPA